MKKNTEKLATYGTQDEEKHRETDNIWYTRRRKTQRNWQHMVHKMKKNTEKLATYGTQDEEKHRETGNIWVHKTKKTKQRHNIICVGHHYAQTNTNNVNKTWALLQNCM
jgi:hypothetical protein